MKDNEMDFNERKSMLQEAQDLINEAIELIMMATDDTYVGGTVGAYTIPTLQMAISNDHDYLGGNPGNIQELIDGLNESEGVTS